MATTILGRKPSAPPASDAGFGLPPANQARWTKLGTAPRHLWAYKGGARIGKQTGEPNGTAYLGYYGGPTNPAARIGYRPAFTVSTVLADNTGGTNNEGDLAAPFLVLSGAEVFGEAHLSVAGGLGQDNSGATMWFRSSVTGTPPNPSGYTSSSPQGQASIWLEAEDNVAPDTPVNRSPSTTQTTTTPTFGADFRDDNEVVGSFAVGDADKLKQYKIQLRLVGSGTNLWDATYTADPTEQAARRYTRIYAGAALSAGNSYEWRTQVSDQTGAWSAWSSWLSFAINAGGTVTLSGAPTGKITDTTPDFAFSWTHGSALSTNAVQIQLLQGGVVTKTSAIITKTVASGASGTITAAESGFGTLTRGQTYGYKVRGRDTGNLWSEYSAERSFSVNGLPNAPTNLSPANGAVVSALPLLKFKATDPDDAVATLTGQVRIKNSGGTLLQTRTAPYNAATGYFEYQTISADMAAPGTFRWDGRAIDAEGYGPYSSEYVVVYGTGPVFTITSPTHAQVLTTSTPTFTWSVTSGGPQAKVYVIIATPSYINDDNVHFATNIAHGYPTNSAFASTDAFFTVPAGWLHEDVPYTAYIYLHNNLDLLGVVEREFSIDYVPPASIAGFAASAELAEGDPDGYPSAIFLTWEASAVDPDGFGGYVIDRYPDGEGPDQAVVLGLFVLTSQGDVQARDHTAASGQPYRFTIRQLVTQGADETESVPVEAFATVTLAGVVLTDVAAPEERRALLRYVAGRGVRPVSDRTVVRTWAEKPTILEGETNYRELSGTFNFLLRAEDDALTKMRELRALYGRRPDRSPIVVCIRDEDGNKLFARITEMPETANARNVREIQIVAVEINYAEGSA